MTIKHTSAKTITKTLDTVTDVAGSIGDVVQSVTSSFAMLNDYVTYQREKLKKERKASAEIEWNEFQSDIIQRKKSLRSNLTENLREIHLKDLQLVELMESEGTTELVAESLKEFEEMISSK